MNNMEVIGNLVEKGTENPIILPILIGALIFGSGVWLGSSIAGVAPTLPVKS